MALHGRRARWACIPRGGHWEAADLEVGYHHGGVSKKKKCIFLAYEIENDYLCKVNVMDINKSIMQIRGGHPTTTHEVCLERYVRDDNRTRMHQAAQARYTANDTSGDDRGIPEREH